MSDEDPSAIAISTCFAAAQANAGKFEEAAATEAEAIAIAPPDVRPFYESRLDLYKKNQPYRDVLKAGSAVEVERQARRY